MAYTFTIEESLVSAAITILLATVFIRTAARLVLDRSSWVAALLTAILSTAIASFLAGWIDGTLGLVVGIIAWSALTAIFFRTRWLKAAIIGLVAWIMWFLVSLLIDRLFG